MPAIAPIVIADGATTPVNHTYNPDQNDMSSARWVEPAASGVAIGMNAITMSRRGPVNGGSSHKVTFGIELPKVVTTTDTSGKSVTSVDYTNRVEINLLLDKRSVKQDRKDLRVLVHNLLNDVAVQALVDDLIGIY